jgi:hypothetical protein
METAEKEVHRYNRGSFKKSLKIGGYRGLIQAISAISSGIIIVGRMD